MSELLGSPAYSPQLDLGTPLPIQFAETVTLNVDGQEIIVPAGTSVMRAAELANITIPKICATDSLDAFGSCRICLVEIEGRKGHPASCTTPAEDGMVVKTESEKLGMLRRNVLELYLSDHPEECATEHTVTECRIRKIFVGSQWTA